METIMTRTSILVAAALVLTGGGIAHAQSTDRSAGNLTTAKPTTTTSGTTVRQKPPTRSTSEMHDEAVQRSAARAAKARALGITEQWGMEEPFTYTPSR
jgi:hypothetical protein